MNQKKLIKKVRNEMKRIAEATDIDVQTMPEQDLDRWVKELVRRFWE